MSTSISTPASSTALCRADRIGFAASVLCAVHCALLPVLLALLPFLGATIARWEAFDTAIVLFVTVLGITTLTLGWRRHRSLRAGWVLLAGLALLWTASVTPLHEYVVPHAIGMTLGGLSVAAAHFLNLRLTHTHNAACCCHGSNAGKNTQPMEQMATSDPAVHADAC